MIEKEPLAALLRAGRRRDGRWPAANDPRITLVAGGYPLFAGGKIAGGIGVGGGTEEQDCAIAEYVVSVFEQAVS